MLSMLGCRSTIAAALLIAALVLLPAKHASASARAFASGCGIPHHGEHLGPTYLTSLTVNGTSCHTGLAVVRAYHACQLRHGGVKSVCRAAVEGFRCSEKRGPSIPTEFSSSVLCRNGAERVSYKYSQFT